MMIGTAFFVALSLARSAPAPDPEPQRSPCAEAFVDAGAFEICAGDKAAWLANAALKGSAERTRLLEAAAEHYRKAVLLTSRTPTKVLALNLLTESYAAHALNDPRRMQAAIWEMIRLTPNDLAPVYRLSKCLEDQGLFDAAEQTLLSAHQQRPDEIEPYLMLADFYSRRADARRKELDLTSDPNAAVPHAESQDTLDMLRRRSLVEETLRRTLGTDTR